MAVSLFACFPVCLTFVGLAILALLVIATGVVGPGPESRGEEGIEVPIQPRGDGPTGPPPWWVVSLIFLAVALSFFFLNWIGADWQPGR
jgi:hypothetical protein